MAHISPPDLSSTLAELDDLDMTQLFDLYRVVHQQLQENIEENDNLQGEMDEKDQTIANLATALEGCLLWDIRLLFVPAFCSKSGDFGPCCDFSLRSRCFQVDRK